MKFLLLALLPFSLWAQTGDYYLVNTPNLDLQKKIAKNTSTVFKRKQTWVVQLKKDSALLSSAGLKKLGWGEVNEIPSEKIGKRKLSQDILNIVSQVSKSRLQSDLQNLVNIETRKAGTAGSETAQHMILAEFRALGLEAKRVCYAFSNGTPYCNVVAQKKGPGENAKTIAIVGHYDTVGKAFAGADDNTSGTVGVLEAARILSQEKMNHNILFVTFDAEELGLYGSKALASQMAREGTIKDIRMLFNMDMIGYNKTNMVTVQTDSKYEADARRIAEIIQTITPYKSEIMMPASRSDHEPFAKKGVSAHLTIEDWDNHNPCYHQTCDQEDLMDWDFVEGIVKSNIAAILDLDRNG